MISTAQPSSTKISQGGDSLNAEHGWCHTTDCHRWMTAFYVTGYGGACVGVLQSNSGALQAAIEQSNEKDALYICNRAHGQHSQLTRCS